MKAIKIALGAVMLIAAPVEAQESDAESDLTVVPPIQKTYQPQKTSWGEPDLRGVWPIDHLNGTPLQRDVKEGNRVFLTEEEYAQRTKRIEDAAARYDNEDSSNQIGQGHWVEMGEVNRRTSLIIAPANGRLPELTEEGKRRSAEARSSWKPGQTFDWTSDFNTWDRCITRGIPASMFPYMYNNGLRIFQAPGLVAIQMEMVHETRMIPTDGRPPIPSNIHNWIGESRGHWDGNTLVVETTNFKVGPSATNMVTTETPLSSETHILETFTMTGPDSIVYEMTYTDPLIFTEPWTTRLDWKRNSEYEFFEYACHEGNVQIRNYINASRAERAATQE